MYLASIVKMSSMFKKEVMECKRELFICEMHYAEDDIEYTKTGIKTPRLQALPTMNLPLNHTRTQKLKENYLLFELLQQRQVMLKERMYLWTKILMSCIKECRSVIWITEKWYTSYENNAVKLTFNIEPHIVPYLEVVIDEKLQFTIIVFGWLLPNCHALY